MLRPALKRLNLTQRSQSHAPPGARAFESHAERAEPCAAQRSSVCISRRARRAMRRPALKRRISRRERRARRAMLRPALKRRTSRRERRARRAMLRPALKRRISRRERRARRAMRRSALKRLNHTQRAQSPCSGTALKRFWSPLRGLELGGEAASRKYFADFANFA